MIHSFVLKYRFESLALFTKKFQMAHLLSPSVLSADFGNLQNVCELINTSKADCFHLDVMDGLFVPNISFGFPVMKTIFKYAEKPVDVHLMIINPNPYLERYRDAGTHTITIHFETCKNLQHSIDIIKKLELDVCVAINPLTPIACLSEVIATIDSVCLLSVHPGFGGQVFLKESLDRLKELKKLKILKQSKALIKVDGGIKLSNYQNIVQAGADILVAGYAVFGAEDPIKAIETFKHYA
jgi:ribulose-phosphate 3-epimerase